MTKIIVRCSPTNFTMLQMQLTVLHHYCLTFECLAFIVEIIKSVRSEMLFSMQPVIAVGGAAASLSCYMGRDSVHKFMHI